MLGLQNFSKLQNSHFWYIICRHNIFNTINDIGQKNGEIECVVKLETIWKTNTEMGLT